MYKKISAFILALIIAASCMLTANAATPTAVYKYTVSDGKVTLTDVSTSNAVLDIPAEIEGMPVTAIKSDTFFDVFKMRAFEEINIPASVTEIDTPIVMENASVKCFNVDSKNPAYASEDGVIFNKAKTEVLAYPSEKEDKTYSLPEGVVKIADSAFKYADFQQIELPDSLEYIGDNAFYKCVFLKRLTIPKAVEYIGRDALLLNYSLYEVYVDVNSKHFSSYNGVLFNKDKTAILYYPVAKTGDSYTVPESVEAVGYRAFQGASPLTSVTLPEGLKRIEERGFCGCRKIIELNLPSALEYIGYEAFLNIGLEDIVIPEGVSEIKAGAFKGCSSLDEVTIPAGVTKIGEDAFANCSESLTIYGNTGTIAQSEAEKYGYTFVALDSEYTENISGDVNLDAKLNIRDATLLQKHLANIVTLNSTALNLADFDKNGKLNIRDATAIQKNIAGIA